DARIVDSLAVGVDGYIRAQLPSSPFFWKLSGEGIETVSGSVASGDSFRTEIRPFAECDVILETAKNGFAVGRTIIPARICYGRLNGSVKDSSGALTAGNIEIFVYPEDADTSIEDPSYIISTNAGGNFNAGDYVPCATYDLYPFGFGWKQTEFRLVHHSEGNYDIRLGRASTSPLSGSVSDGAGGPVQAEVVLLHPNGTQLRRTSSGTTGDYSVSAIPYFNYRIAAFARGYQSYIADCPVNSAPTTFDIAMTPVVNNVLIISNGSGAAAESLASHIESFGLSVESTDHVPPVDSLEMFEFVVYSTGGNSSESVIDLGGAWRLLEGHRNGVKILFEGGDLARRYIEASSMPLVITDSLLMLAQYSGDDPDTTVELALSPAEAQPLAHNPDTPPCEISTRDPGAATEYFDMITPASGSAHLLYTKSGSPIKGIVSYYADSLGAGVHRMGYMFFKYDDALLDVGANKRILRNFVEWFRAPDFDHGVLIGRAVVVGGSPDNIVVSGGGGTDTTAIDGRFTLHVDPGMFAMTFSSPHINDTTHYGVHLAPGEIKMGYVAMLSVSEPVMETDLPAKFELLAVYPNPFNGVVSFEVQTPKATKVEIELFDIVGKLVHKGSKTIDGQSTIAWDTRGDRELSSGVYLYRVFSGKIAFRGKIVLAK
ncbi:T9SS type A sorting domain-containing protein, partial [bacterium]|nr:T9SS type A sorting domain-containing protein [bacterium]